MTTFNPKKTNDIDDDVISKSELKRQMHERQKLGESLLLLPEKKLKTLVIGEELQEAISLAKEMKNDNGRRRQLQRIGKLMRHEDIASINAQLDDSIKKEKLQQNSYQEQQAQIKHHYTALVSEKTNALTHFIEQYPQANRQRLRQLISNIRKETQKTQDPASISSSKNTKRLISEIEEVLKNTSA